jgi:hypothetical protein
MNELTNKTLILKKLTNDGLYLELRNNYEIVIAAVKSNGNALKYASKELKNNYKIVMEAVKKNGH